MIYMSLSLKCQGEPIIEGQPAMHHTQPTIMHGVRYIQCGKCGELAPIHLRLDILIKYVNQLWGGRTDTIFPLTPFKAKVVETEIELFLDGGGIANGDVGIFFDLKDFPDNRRHLDEIDLEYLENPDVIDTYFLGWIIAQDKDEDIRVIAKSGMEAHEIPMVDADECKRILEYVEQRMKQYDSRLSE